MKLMAMDTSGMVATVAVLEDDCLIAEYTVNYKLTHSQTIMPMLDEIMRMTNQDLSTFDGIAVAAGPGSFTGLRIGSATAKGIAQVLDKPIIEVPTLKAMAANFYGSSALICPIMDARRQQVYNGLYRYEDNKLKTVEDQRAISVETLCQELNHLLTKDDSLKQVIFFGDAVPVYGDKIKELMQVPYTFAPANMNRQRASSVGVVGMEMMREGICVKAEEHAPIYLRRSQAERERDERALDIRAMTTDDIPVVMAIENKTGSGSGWTENGLLTYLLKDDTLFMVAEKDGQVLGYAALLQSFDEGDILNIAVRADKRRLGIGGKLMQVMRIEAGMRGVNTIHLEVRESNTPALGLYEKMGFTKDGIRKNYYTDPVENAITMTLK